MEIRAHHTSFCLNHHAVKIWTIFWMTLLSKYPKKLVQPFDTCILPRYVDRPRTVCGQSVDSPWKVCGLVVGQTIGDKIDLRAKKFLMLIK